MEETALIHTESGNIREREREKERERRRERWKRERWRERERERKMESMRIDREINMYTLKLISEVTIAVTICVQS